MTINSAKPADTADLIMGAGATGYSWYRGSERPHVWSRSGTKAFEDWHITLLMEDTESDDEDDNVRVTLDHQVVMKWARYVVANKGKLQPPTRSGVQHRCWSQALERECTNLLFHVDDADFDAESADELIQLAAYSEVVFG